MKKTIKQQLVFHCVVIVVLIVGITWLLSAFLLEKYFIHRKVNKLIDAYNVLNENVIYENETIDESMLRLCSLYDINFIVTDASANVVRTSINNYEALSELLRDFIFARESEEVHMLIRVEESYSICVWEDPDNNMRYMTMWGYLSNGNFFMIRSSLESIKYSVHLVNGFLLCIVAVAGFVGCVAVEIVSNKVSKPIMDLTEISRKMANLDFDARYEGKVNDEIGELGANFNHMSETLENTIKELKAANLDLKMDVEKREKLDKIRTEFLSDVSHELKTPIALIQGYAEGLKEGISDDLESKEFYCDVIIDETKKMNHLVKQLLTLNQLELGNESLSIERFDINELISNCIASGELLVKNDNIKIDFVFEGVLNVWADEYEIEEVIRNYLNNAINHVDDNKIVRISTSNTENGVRVSVYNSGKNIAEEYLDKIWNKFYKIDRARCREYGGSGVGLSIVKAIIEKHNGRFGVINESFGVTFWFELDDVY